MRGWFHILSLVLLLAGAAVILSFTDRSYHNNAYQTFRIDVLNPSSRALITEKEIMELVSAEFGPVAGSIPGRINLVELENKVEANPYISTCEVYEIIGCGLEMKVRVRQPLVRIINEENKHFYLDLNGCAMPVNPAHPLPVLVASGWITDEFVSLDKSERSLKTFPEGSILRQIYRIARYIGNDEFLSSFIEQIYVPENAEIELVPKIGSQAIIFGNAENAEEKLENLKAFYLQVMPYTNWKKYKSINLKYNNQVICTKSENYEKE